MNRQNFVRVFFVLFESCLTLFQFTFQLNDTATATNEWSALNTLLGAGTLITVTVNMPGAFDSTALYSWSGFLSDLTTPELAANDTMLTYTATLTVTA